MVGSCIISNSVATHLVLESEQETKRFAQSVARAYQNTLTSNKSLVVYLKGDLGAGKSFFSRAFIQSFLPDQKVKSPTYTIVESYQTPFTTVHHFDLYRLCDPEELEYLAIRDLLTEPSVALVEWPQKGEGVLPEADVLIDLQHLSDVNGEMSDTMGDQVRGVDVSAHTEVGKQLLEQVFKDVLKK